MLLRNKTCHQRTGCSTQYFSTGMSMVFREYVKSLGFMLTPLECSFKMAHLMRGWRIKQNRLRANIFRTKMTDFHLRGKVMPLPRGILFNSSKIVVIVFLKHLVFISKNTHLGPSISASCRQNCCQLQVKYNAIKTYL